MSLKVRTNPSITFYIYFYCFYYAQSFGFAVYIVDIVNLILNKF